MRYTFSLLNKTPILIFLATFFLYCEFIAPSVYATLGGVFDGKNLLSLIFVTNYACVCFFILPALTGKFIFNLSLAQLGLKLPSKKLSTYTYTLGSVIILVPFMLYFATLPSFKSYYFLEKISLIKFLEMQLIWIPLYYFAEEFFFRGFIFLGLFKKIGWHSYWVTEVFFTVAHFTKPNLEILFSIPAGIVLSFITLRTKSVYPAIVVHYTMGLALSVVVNFI